MNRLEETKNGLGASMSRVGYPNELLVWDNGSQDGRVTDYVVSLKPAWFHIHPENIGYAKAVNQLIINALKGRRLVDYFCILDPDIALPMDWGQQLTSYCDAIPDSGLIGYHWISSWLKGMPETLLGGKPVRRQNNQAFGIKFFNLAVLQKAGYFCEAYGLYGGEDTDYNVRLDKLGFINYWIGGGWMCKHMGDDNGQVRTAYREFKDEQAKKASVVFEQRNKLYQQGLELYQGPPKPLALRDW